MLDSLILNQQSIENIYETIKTYHQKYLKVLGVKIPKLYNSKKEFTKDALILVYLAYIPIPLTIFYINAIPEPMAHPFKKGLLTEGH